MCRKGYPKRNVERIVVDRLPEGAPELVLSRLLDQYSTVREERFASLKKERVPFHTVIFVFTCELGCSSAKSVPGFRLPQ